MTGFLERLADFQTRRPFVILLLAVVISVVSLFFVRNLGLDSRFIALLPESSPSVQDLDKFAIVFGASRRSPSRCSHPRRTWMRCGVSSRTS